MSATPTSKPEAHDATQPAAIWTLRLWGLGDRRLELAATAATVLLLAWTRFAFLASGPWEWDETLFARGILRFDIHAHFPHPPGFPLWLALGWLVNPLVSEPLRGLQLLSALSSVLTLWPLAALARRMAPARVAMAATLVFLMLPGVWLHAPRGFSETPSAFLALWAAAVLVDGLGGRRVTLFTLLVTASFLVRPIILPSLAILWLAGALSVRPRTRLLVGVAAGAGAVVAAILGMVFIQGSWQEFVEAFGNHATRHARGLAENVVGFSELGIVKGTGGMWPAITLLILAGLGLVVWARRRGWRFAAAWAAVWVIGVAQLVWLQDRKYPRYAVLFQLAAAPLAAAGAAAAAPAAAAAGGLAALGAFLGVRAYPLVEEQHANLMSSWAAVHFASAAANRDGYDLLLEPGIAPFVSYLQELDKRSGRPWTAQVYGAPTPSSVKTLPKGRYLLVTDRPERYLQTIGKTWSFTLQSQELTPLTQGRWQHVLVLEDPVLPIAGWQTVVRDEKQLPFVWGGTQARLLLPPLPAGTSVAMEVEPTRGASALELQVNGRTAAVLSGTAGRRTIWVPAGALVPERTNELAFSRPEAYAPRPGGRPYALRLSGLQIAGGGKAWSGSIAPGGGLARLGVAITSRSAAAADVEFTGVYGSERFPFGVGAWTTPTARLRAPAQHGVLTLLAWAPRPTAAQLEVWSRGSLLAGPLTLTTAPGQLQLFLPQGEPGTALDLELRSAPFVSPSGSGRPPLGVVIADMQFDAATGSTAQGWRGTPDERGGWTFSSVTRGTYDLETLEGVRAAWTAPEVALRLPAGPGLVELTVLAPRPTSPRLEVWAGGRRLAGPIDLPPTPVTIPVTIPADLALARGLELELRSVPFVPARFGGSDTRALGIALSRVAYVPAEPGSLARKE